MSAHKTKKLRCRWGSNSSAVLMLNRSGIRFLTFEMWLKDHVKMYFKYHLSSRKMFPRSVYRSLVKDNLNLFTRDRTERLMPKDRLWKLIWLRLPSSIMAKSFMICWQERTIWSHRKALCSTRTIPKVVRPKQKGNWHTVQTLIWHSKDRFIFKCFNWVLTNWKLFYLFYQSSKQKLWGQHIDLQTPPQIHSSEIGLPI